MTNSSEYFEYRVPSKFIGEIQIVLSSIILASGIVSIASFSTHFDTKVGHDRDIAVGYITYSSLIVGVALIDLIFAFILISATNKISLPRCILWRGSALATLFLFGMLTISFMALMRTPKIIFGFLPSLIFKPFSLWVVKGFINELRELQNFPSNVLPPSKPSFSLENPIKLKRTTTIFSPTGRGSIGNDRRSFMITSKFSSISEGINE